MRSQRGSVGGGGNAEYIYFDLGSESESEVAQTSASVGTQTASHQAPPSLGFSRQEHWSGLPFPSPMRESEK